ncbi:uncharacterized protein BCR38DRAFT_487162 [Pseudomassariella vexata]|uniref:DUF7871 domain-containing protein n=1 Tax=Pseudomassariella vexata TaxID=1141098 RepID=A0A1Y2DQ46_9PEZI|nr:uncharacterized protein BCR38DRAFT_487162 [Pseudomassariella vexata]ORY61411.1 hypothetical protein BCR38DRAFT_487162 [Pseudomassariella vexata]
MAIQVTKATSTCCGKAAGGECVCAKEAKCSCGKQAALNCTCDKAQTENNVTGARCQCGARPAGACTCGSAGSASGSNANEIDFTTKK